MDPFPFRPELDHLDPRLLPSVTPTDVYSAVVYTQAAGEVLQWQSQNMNAAQTPDKINALAAFYPAVAQGSAAAAATLSEFGTQVQAQAAASPASGLDQLMAQIASMQSQAQVAAGYAQMYAVAFGAQATAAGSTATTPTDAPTVDASGMAAAMPPVSDPGWQALPDGLKVWDVQTGTGTAVTSASTVSVFYTGWLASNGTRFDTNTTDGTPMAFRVSGLIKGWQEGLIGMQAGGIRRLYIPAALAYGSTAQGPIPANSDLVFEVKLVANT